MKFTPRCDQFILMKDLEINPHRIDFERMAREWPSEFGEDPPSPSDVKRRLENLRDRAMEKRHVQNLSIKKVRSESRHSQSRQHRLSDGPPMSGNTSSNAIVSKQEEHSDSEVRNTYSTPNTVSDKRNHQQVRSAHLAQRGSAPADDDTDLPELDTMIGVKDKDKDMMKLRPIPKPNYQNDGVIYHDDDQEYDPVAERAEEDRKEAQKERQRQRTASVMQGTVPPTCPRANRNRSVWTSPASSPAGDMVEQSHLRSAQPKPNRFKMPVWQARPPMQPHRETYKRGRDSQLVLKQNTHGLPVGRQQARQSGQSQQQVFSQEELQKEAGNEDVKGEPNEDPSAGVADVPQRKKKKKNNKRRKHKKDSSVQETRDELERAEARTGSVSQTRAAIKVPKKKKSHKRHRSEED